MKFEKDNMEVVLYLKSEHNEELPSKVKGTISKFNLNVDREVDKLKTKIELGAMIFFEGDTYGTSGDVVESFEVLNYLDLKPEEGKGCD